MTSSGRSVLGRIASGAQWMARAATKSYYSRDVLSLLQSRPSPTGRADGSRRRAQPARPEISVSSRAGTASGRARAVGRQARPRTGRVGGSRRAGHIRRVGPGERLAGQGLPGKVFLLAFDPVAGRLVGRSRLGAVLRAAALIDLQLAGYLADERGRVSAARSGAPADPVLAELLAEIRASRPRKWKYWIDRKHGPIVRATRAELDRNRLIRVERRRRFGLVPVHQLTLREPLARRQLLTAVHDALRPARLVARIDLADAALAVLASTGDLRSVVSKEQRKRHKDRLDQLAVRVGPVVPALKKSLQQASAAAAAG